jgi:hypothetical protein
VVKYLVGELIDHIIEQLAFLPVAMIRVAEKSKSRLTLKFSVLFSTALKKVMVAATVKRFVAL